MKIIIRDWIGGKGEKVERLMGKNNELVILVRRIKKWWKAKEGRKTET